jgi:hypothetical protein
VSQADAPLPASAPDFAAKPYGPAKGGLPAQLPNLPDLLVRANFSLINDSMPFDLIGSTTLSTQAGHMARQAFSNLPDVIDTISLDFLQKNNALLLAQHIASFDANQSGPSSSPGITLPESASPQALLVANFGPH